MKFTAITEPAEITQLIAAVVVDTLKGYEPAAIREAQGWVTRCLITDMQVKFDKLENPTAYIVVSSRKQTFKFLRHIRKINES